MFLNDKELSDLTKRKRAKAQQRQLNAMGIQYKVRADGTLVVLHAHVERIFGGDAQNPRPRRAREPNWEALRHA